MLVASRVPARSAWSFVPVFKIHDCPIKQAANSWINGGCSLDYTTPAISNLALVMPLTRNLRALSLPFSFNRIAHSQMCFWFMPLDASSFGDTIDLFYSTIEEPGIQMKEIFEKSFYIILITRDLLFKLSISSSSVLLRSNRASNLFKVNCALLINIIIIGSTSSTLLNLIRTIYIKELMTSLKRSSYLSLKTT